MVRQQLGGTHFSKWMPERFSAFGVFRLRHGTMPLGLFAWDVVSRVQNRNCNNIVDFDIPLLTYAQDHDGRFPDGGDTADVALAKLAEPRYGVQPQLLCGKSVLPEVTEWGLHETHSLTPDTCGWRYQPGLTLCDNPQLAIIWDKVGTDEFYYDCSLRGSHEVLYLGGTKVYVRANDWPLFF